jgi:RNA polymerase sigma-70 factor (ECF subfamily)
VALDLRDPEQFQRVYDTHSGGVYGAAMRVLADPTQAQDVVQDVFLRVWRRPGSFDPGRGEIGPYLRLMGRSRALDLWREAQAYGRAGDRLKVVVAGEAPRTEDRPAAVLEREDTRAAVREALAVLPAPQREALVLAYWGGLTAEEIARRAGVPLGTAKSRIRLALDRLRSEGGLAGPLAA